MKRVVIFVLLGPQLVFGLWTASVYIAAGRFVWLNLQQQLIYAIVGVSFLLLCGLDAILQRLQYRPVLIGLASFAIALLLTRDLSVEPFERWWLAHVFVCSAIPAAVCSWLSSEKQNGRAQ
jgi:ABC-type branched-subunit amino acid transport system permease subunit